MAAEKPSEPLKIPMPSLNPVDEFEEIRVGMERNESALRAQQIKNRQEADATSSSLLDEDKSKPAAEVQDKDVESRPIPSWQLARAQTGVFKRLQLGGKARNAIVKAVGIDTSSGKATYGPDFARKVAKFQRETLGFTWDNKDARIEGRVPNGIIDENTLLAMSKLPGAPMDTKETMDLFAEAGMKETPDETQKNLCAKMLFTDDQIHALFKLVGAESVPTLSGIKLTEEKITTGTIKVLTKQFQIEKLGFMDEKEYAALPKNKKDGVNVADGYFGPKSLAALKEKGIALFPDKDPRQDAISVLLGKKVEKAA